MPKAWRPRSLYDRGRSYTAAVLSALLISDIHFRREQRLGGPDRDIELRNGLLRFLPELRELLPEISLILVCGDVAFQAVEHEYALAREFLQEVQAELRGARILLIPGNHDIDREIATRPEQRMWRSSLRLKKLSVDNRDDKLMELLNDAEAGPGLFEALTAYNSFAAQYQCAISVRDPNPYWHATVPINDRYRAEIRGLTSVLISDSHDNKSTDRLVLGEFQAADLASGTPGVVNVTMCHHPYTWLFDGQRQENKLDRRCALHITGHDHDHEIVRNGGDLGVQLRAGALQPRRNPEWAPRLYGLSFDVDEGDEACSASIRIVSALWVRETDGFVIEVDKTEKVLIRQAEEAIAPGSDPRILRLTERLGSLQTGDLWSVAAEMGADLGALSDGPFYEIPQRLVELAEKQGQLPELWRLTELRRGQQERDNPFA